MSPTVVRDDHRTSDLLAEKERLVQEEADLVHRLVTHPLQTLLSHIIYQEHIVEPWCVLAKQST